MIPTPLVPVGLTVGGRRRRLVLKLEGAAGGSIKDRTARSLVDDLERRGLLRSGRTLIESTSGNLGVALAAIAAERGHGFVAVVDPKVTAENVAALRSLGARIESVDRPDATGGFLLSRLDRVRRLCRASGELVWPDQYRNPANPQVHELETGPELHRQLGGRIDAVVVAVSTGGTLAGVARFFRSASPSTLLVAADAVGSVALGGLPGRRLLTGLGASRRSTFLSRDLYDEEELVGDGEAFAACRALARETSIAVGGSGGAVLVAAARLLSRRPALRRVVCLCADAGDRYETSIYDDGWLSRHGFDPDAPPPDPIESLSACVPAHAVA